MIARPLFSKLSGLLLGLLIFNECGNAAEDRVEKIELTIQIQPAPPAAEPSSFEEVTAKLDKGGLLYLYLSTEQWLAGLSSYIGSFRDAMLPAAGLGNAKKEKALRAFDTVTGLIKKSGLEEISGVGASSVAIEPGLYRNKFFAHHGKGTGFLWSAFGAPSHRWTALDFLPADTALASFSDLDLPQLIGIATQAIEQSGNRAAKKGLDAVLLQFAAMTGMQLNDAIESFGGSVGIVLTLDPANSVRVPINGKEEAIPVPRIALFLKVKDDRIFNQIDKITGVNPFVMRVDEPELKMRTVPMPILPQFTARATAAMWDGYLILASDDKLVRDFVATRKEGRGLKATPEWIKLAAGLPEEGDGFHFVSQRFAEVSNRLQAGLMKTRPGDLMMQKLLDGQKTGASFTVSAHLDNGWLAVGNGTLSGPQIIRQMLMAPAIIAAGLFQPVEVIILP
ncbi:MAG: hypothetical protein JWL59_2973 [Chthoniobacteraceae bacterium]|nr:hypothetical protein [Chthoniobacteraceae bacterium]